MEKNLQLIAHFLSTGFKVLAPLCCTLHQNKRTQTHREKGGERDLSKFLHREKSLFSSYSIFSLQKNSIKEWPMNLLSLAGLFWYSLFPSLPFPVCCLVAEITKAKKNRDFFVFFLKNNRCFVPDFTSIN